VLLPACLSPARSLVAYPGLTAPMVGVWLVLTRFARRLAVPAAFAAAAVALVVDGRVHANALSHPLLRLTAVAPTFQLGTVLSIALPLFLVTMASQNLAGMTVLRLHGYEPPLGPVLTSTGAVSVASAPFGAHAVNLAAITAALMAGPDGGPRPERRWIAAASGGLTYVILGLFTGLATGFVAGAPPVLIEAVAGLALLGALGGAMQRLPRLSSPRPGSPPRVSARPFGASRADSPCWPSSASARATTARGPRQPSHAPSSSVSATSAAQFLELARCSRCVESSHTN
jgi:benzoate membrane transport protein